ncbi:hypothetical protein L1F30_03850 [Simiduia sp. 21SJ11W-1]|uniref:hypothetical protein n=1 Tax=Simiduia sp. 21SJ11W-1 TaxID=2909669 RepID=UPI00209FB934|nr:hypothetical protein [Simiduia sp. 21SJ11W-1]UTA48681.1 hypothetical protein L1F30_03850 [Simiduia sp. 21SJ11W-1]
MSEALFDIVFRGDIAPGHKLPEVKQRMATLFKREAAQIEGLFTGSPVPLKKSIDHASAEKYQKVLAQAGALVEIRPAGTLKTEAARAPAARARPARAPEAAGPANEPAAKPAVAKPAVAASAAAGLSLAPVGGDILTPDERNATAVPKANVQPLSADLRPLDGPLVDAQEIDRAAPVAVPELDFDIAEAGADLIEPQYRQAPEAVAVADLAVELAPPGADLGQVPKEVPPPPPDTSGITLAD